MFDFEKPKIEIAEISEDKTYGRFVVELLLRIARFLIFMMISVTSSVLVSQEQEKKLDRSLITSMY